MIFRLGICGALSMSEPRAGWSACPLPYRVTPVTEAHQDPPGKTDKLALLGPWAPPGLPDLQARQALDVHWDLNLRYFHPLRGWRTVCPRGYREGQDSERRSQGRGRADSHQAPAPQTTPGITGCSGIGSEIFFLPPSLGYRRLRKPQAPAWTQTVWNNSFSCRLTFETFILRSVMQSCCSKETAVPSPALLLSMSPSLCLQRLVVPGGARRSLHCVSLRSSTENLSQNILWENLKIVFLSVSLQPLATQHLRPVASCLLPHSILTV